MRARTVRFINIFFVFHSITVSLLIFRATNPPRPKMIFHWVIFGSFTEEG